MPYLSSNALAFSLPNSGRAASRLAVTSARYFTVRSRAVLRSSGVVASKNPLRERPALISAMLASLTYDKPIRSRLYMRSVIAFILRMSTMPMPATIAPTTAISKNPAVSLVPTFIFLNIFIPRRFGLFMT